MRIALVLLAVFAAGFMLGRTTSETRETPRTARTPERATPPVVAVRTEPPARAPEAVAPGREEPTLAGTAVRPAEEESGLGAEGGWVEVRFPESAPCPRAFLHVRDTAGGWIDAEFSTLESEFVQVAEARAGSHLVWWREAEGHRRLGCHVRVEAGMIVTVDASAARELPPRDDLGRLLLTVAGADGLPRRGVAARLVVATAVETDEVVETTDSGGRCQFDVPPGVHTLRLGVWTREVRLAAGETVDVSFRPVGQGSLLLEFSPPAVTAYAEVPDVGLIPSDARDGARHLFLALPPGEFDFSANLSGQGNDRRPAGRHVVRAAREMTESVRLPTGSLTVEVILDGRWVSVGIAPGPHLPWGLQQAAAPRGPRQPWETQFLALPAGEYVVTAYTSAGSESRRVSVGGGPARLAFDGDPR